MKIYKTAAYKLSQSGSVTVPFTIQVWDENMDYGEDENGQEVSYSDGPPGWQPLSFHQSQEGAQLKLQQLQAQDPKGSYEIVPNSDYPSWYFEQSPQGMGMKIEK